MHAYVPSVLPGYHRGRCKELREPCEVGFVLGSVSKYNHNMKWIKYFEICTVNTHFPLSKTGRRATSADIILDELLHMLWSGCPWRALRCKGTSFQTVHRHFTKWSRSGVFKEAYAIAYKLQSRPTRRNLRFHCIDSSFVKNCMFRTFWHMKGYAPVPKKDWQSC